MEGVLTRAVFFRALALVYLMALVSLWWQADGLIGSDGIMPVERHLDRVAEQMGVERYWRVPTMLWVLPGDFGIDLLVGMGAVFALLLLIGTTVDGWVLLWMWAIYLSLTTAGQIFLQFQWDSLLLEVLFVAALWAQWLPGPVRPPAVWARWLAWWVVFKLFFFAGLVKLTSGDPTWRDGTAMLYHYWTQPLPNPVSWYVDQLPGPLHVLSQLLMFLVELVVPFGILLGARARRVIFVPMAGLMGLLFFTGNYGYFQPLTIALCLTLLDDEAWKRVLPVKVVEWVPEAEQPARNVAAPVAALLVLTGLLFARDYDKLPEFAQSWARAAYPFRTANSYGLFAVMTTERPVVVFEASDDGENWTPIWLPHQTGPTDRIPSQVAPHMPRLDWQLWFAGLSDCFYNSWVLKTQIMLKDREWDVWQLFETEMPIKGPKHVRTMRYSYVPAESGEEGWWKRELVGEYCPPAPPLLTLPSVLPENLPRDESSP